MCEDCDLCPACGSEIEFTDGENGKFYVWCPRCGPTYRLHEVTEIDGTSTILGFPPRSGDDGLMVDHVISRITNAFAQNMVMWGLKDIVDTLESIEDLTREEAAWARHQIDLGNLDWKIVLEENWRDNEE